MSPKVFFQTQLDELIRDCLYGQMHFRAWQKINEALRRKTEALEVSPLFFNSTLLAHLNSTRLHLFRLLDTWKGAISIFDLIEYANKNKVSIFKNIGEFDVLYEQHKKRLNSFENLIKSLPEQRNKGIYHKSKDYITRGFDKLYEEYKTTYSDYDKILGAIGEILNDYLGLLEDREYSLKFVDEDIEFYNLLHFIVKVMEAADKEDRNL